MIGHTTNTDTIVAQATANGPAAIALIRLSGPNALSILERHFFSSQVKKIEVNLLKPKQLHFGTFVKGGKVLDEVLVAIFRAPKSYTGEDLVEISCHASPYIRQHILQLCLASGARMAEPGEFTMRAFLNGRMDLSQAEAVADLINSQSGASHQLAMQQMRGGYSNKIAALRGDLIHFASLIELELDFSEEDVEFADRTALLALINRIQMVIKDLLKSFELGNVIKNGIPVAIVGKPNAGKSTLLNAFLNEERAIVSEIPGTTRDTIEDQMSIDGINFRFIDTAGIRQTEDIIEKIGVDRAFLTMRQAAVVMYLFDPLVLNPEELATELTDIRQNIKSAILLVIANKMDTDERLLLKEKYSQISQLHFISAKSKIGLDELKLELVNYFEKQLISAGDVVVTNARHATALQHASEALTKVESGLNTGIPGDLLALDIRFALEQLGHITGQVTSEDLLTNIFTRFCIGK